MGHHLVAYLWISDILQILPGKLLFNGIYHVVNGDFAASLKQNAEQHSGSLASSIFLRVAIMQAKLVNSAVGQHGLKFVAFVIDIYWTG